jgi:excinuclease ABC subunit C
MTVMENDELKKSAYRKFKIKSLARGEVNDIVALKEVLNRRFAHLEWTMPDLIVADGGEAQKRAVEDVLKTLKISIPVVSVVKDKRHKAREILGVHSKNLPENLQRIFSEKNIILLNSEAHRYAVAFHRKLRGKI